MTKVLSLLKHSPIACTVSISFGIGVMLSVAYLEPSDSTGIHLRHAIGAAFLLLPGIAQRFDDDEEF